MAKPGCVHAIDFRINRPIPHDVPGVASVHNRAGFENWERPDAFVIQMEEARGFDADRGITDWSPIARFEHLRPHDLFDPTEGIHLDVYRRADSTHEYKTIDIGVSSLREDTQALFFSLVQVFELDSNVETLLHYYVEQRGTIRSSAITLPDELVS